MSSIQSIVYADVPRADGSVQRPFYEEAAGVAVAAAMEEAEKAEAAEAARDDWKEAAPEAAMDAAAEAPAALAEASAAEALAAMDAVLNVRGRMVWVAPVGWESLVYVTVATGSLAVPLAVASASWKAAEMMVVLSKAPS